MAAILYSMVKSVNVTNWDLSGWHVVMPSRKIPV